MVNSAHQECVNLNATVFRSMRGSRPGSLKLSGNVKENGDITHLMMGGGSVSNPSTVTHRTDDFDIKMIQQRKQQAEIKR